MYALMDSIDKHDYASIGAFFNKDHSTVIHGIEMVNQQLKIDSSFRDKIARINKHLEYNK